jgi:hypothetical protein
MFDFVSAAGVVLFLLPQAAVTSSIAASRNIIDSFSQEYFLFVFMVFDSLPVMK